MAALAATCLAVFVDSAQAQSGGWALDRYEPSPAGDTFFAAESPWYAHDGLAFRSGVVFDYARNPLVVRGEMGSDVSTRVVENMLVAHAQLGIALGDRLNFHLSVPLSLWQSGEAEATLGLEPGGFTVGDPRIGARVRILGDADDDAFSLHAGAMAFIPAGALGVDRANNTTDDAFRLKLNLTAAGHAGAMVWSVGLGYHVRTNTIENASTTIGDDMFWNAAIGFVAMDDRLTIAAEFFGATTADGAFAWKQLNAEVIVGAHYRIADSFLVGVGAGPGLTQGAGTPQFRALLQLAYAPVEEAAPPPPADRDGDGVVDPDDQCVDEPMGANPDPALRGCPLRDRDGDGVLDPDDQCIDEPMGANPDPALRGCPLRDRDGDGVFDGDDLCVDVPQGPSPDPAQRGCPDGDEDHDGVLNAQDACRTVPQGPFPDPARAGCPLPDRDHDGIPEPPDACPDEPGAPSTNPARNGCPGLVTLTEGFLRIVQPVFFATARDVILPRSVPVLEAVADALQAMPHIRRVSIDGHTDDVNDDASNLDLSQRRANSVMTWLVAHGVEAERLEAHGFGETRQVRAIEGLRGRALQTARGINRRVDFRITDPALPEEAGVSGGQVEPQ